jgi:hypothetical protein
MRPPSLQAGTLESHNIAARHFALCDRAATIGYKRNTLSDYLRAF